MDRQHLKQTSCILQNVFFLTHQRWDNLQMLKAAVIEFVLTVFVPFFFECV